MTEKRHTFMVSTPTHGRRGASSRLEFSATAIGVTASAHDAKRKVSMVSVSFRTRQASDGKKPRTWFLHLNAADADILRHALNDIARVTGFTDES